MASRKPLVRVGGQVVQLPAGDTLDGVGTGDFKKDGSVQMTGPINQAAIYTFLAGNPTVSGILDWTPATSDTGLLAAGGTLSSMNGVPAGGRRVLKFAAGTVITHATGIIELPGGANITTALGDSAEFLYRGSSRWQGLWYQRADGTALVSSGSGPATTDALPEGTTNLYFTPARTLAAPLVGFSATTGTVVATDTVLAAIGKLQGSKVASSLIGAASGVASLDSSGKIPSAQLPPLAVNEVFTVASQAAMLALTAERGDVAIRTDQAGKAYILSADAPTVLANWIGLDQAMSAALAALNPLTPAADRLPYFDSASTAALATFTAQARAFLAAATQAAQKTVLGVDQVDNTADTAKPVSVAQQAALDLKAPINNPTFTGSLTTLSTDQVVHAPGAGINAGYEIGSTAGVATNPYLDFHSGATPVDFDTRLGFSGGTGISGNGDCRWQGNSIRFSASVTLDRALKVAAFTLTTLPSASAFNGCLINVTNATGGQKSCVSNGTVWQILNTTTTVS